MGINANGTWDEREYLVMGKPLQGRLASAKQHADSLAQQQTAVNANSTAASSNTAPASWEQQAKEKWRTDVAIRQEFLTESTYIAYCKAVASGSVRISAPAPGLSRHTRAPEQNGS